jgi:opacity protein-like surface antigen
MTKDVRTQKDGRCYGMAAKGSIAVLTGSLAFFSISPQTTAAAEKDTASDVRSPGAFLVDDFFNRGSYEATLSSGVLFSPFGSPRDRPTINYTITSLSLGYMVSRIYEAGWLRGNFEMTLEAFGSYVYDGPGSYIAGGTLWARYNFVPKGWRLTPYIQGGAGLTSTDIDHGIVGEDFNFNLNLGCGLRYFIAPRWSIHLEYQYQHISNANLGHHNLGINAQGPILGLSYFF